MPDDKGGDEKVSPAFVGELLGNSFRFVEDIKEGLPQLEIKDSDIFLTMASLYLFAFLRASQAESIKIDRHTLKEIYDQLASFLVVKYLKQKTLNIQLPSFPVLSQH